MGIDIVHAWSGVAANSVMADPCSLPQHTVWLNLVLCWFRSLAIPAGLSGLRSTINLWSTIPRLDCLSVQFIIKFIIGIAIFFQNSIR